MNKAKERRVRRRSHSTNGINMARASLAHSIIATSKVLVRNLRSSMNDLEGGSIDENDLIFSLRGGR